MGSRYGGLKQIDPVGPAGETIIDYSIFDALRAGFGKLVFVIRKDIEQQFREIVGARFEKRVAVDYVFQALEDIPPRFTVPAGRTKPWGTTQAILLAENAIHEPFAAINADDFYGADAYRSLAGQLTSGSQDYSMVGFVLRNTLSDFGSVARGVCQVSDDGYLEHIAELTKVERDGNGARNTDAAGTVTKLTGDEPVSMNYWGFTPQVFDQLRENFEKFLEGKRYRPEIGVLHPQHSRRAGARWAGARQSVALARFLVRRYISRRPPARRREHPRPHRQRTLSRKALA